MFNYMEMEEAPRTGYISDANGKFLTLSLFHETCPEGREHEIRWCLSENEQYNEKLGRVIPSAWQCYLECPDEYQAMRRIVGNVKQWETLKTLKWFKDKYSLWEDERKMRDKAMVYAALKFSVMQGGSGVAAAAKMLMQEFGEGVTENRGRPRKPKEVENVDPEIKNDLDRIKRVK